MRQSELFSKTQKTAPKDEGINAQLLQRAGFIHKEMAGVYAYLPLGLLVLNKIQGIIREEMNAIGGQELFLGVLQNPEVWKKTGRWDDKAVDIWFKTKMKNDTVIGLAHTHEEPITEMMRNHIHSYRDLTTYAYHFQAKFRNELRARSGLLRTREFIMKDLYSFCRTPEEHEEFYEKAKKAYHTVFKRVGIGKQTLFTYASGGSFSKYSHEFQTIVPAGEDTVFVCVNCSVAVNKEIIKEQSVCPQCSAKALKEERSIEVGNIFSLGTRFAEALGLMYTDENGEAKPVIMGSYGIGPGRLMGTIVELLHDEKGIIWPKAVAPFQVHVLMLPGGEKEAEKLYQQIAQEKIEVLYDDRESTPGEKLADADLFGIPLRIVVSEKTVAVDSVEVKQRSEDKAELVKQKDIVEFILKK